MPLSAQARLDAGPAMGTWSGPRALPTGEAGAITTTSGATGRLVHRHLLSWSRRPGPSAATLTGRRQRPEPYGRPLQIAGLEQHNVAVAPCGAEGVGCRLGEEAVPNGDSGSRTFRRVDRRSPRCPWVHHGQHRSRFREPPRPSCRHGGGWAACAAPRRASRARPRTATVVHRLIAGYEMLKTSPFGARPIRRSKTARPSPSQVALVALQAVRHRAPAPPPLPAPTVACPPPSVVRGPMCERSGWRPSFLQEGVQGRHVTFGHALQRSGAGTRSAPSPPPRPAVRRSPGRDRQHHHHRDREADGGARRPSLASVHRASPIKRV